MNKEYEQGEGQMRRQMEELLRNKAGKHKSRRSSRKSRKHRHKEAAQTSHLVSSACSRLQNTSSW